MKIDVAAKSCIHTWQEKGCWASPAEYVARPNGKAEDDGKFLVVNECKQFCPMWFILVENRTYTFLSMKLVGIF